MAKSKYIVYHFISNDVAFESVNDSPENLVKDNSVVEEVQTLEMMSSPTNRNDGDNAGAYQILRIPHLHRVCLLLIGLCI